MKYYSTIKNCVNEMGKRSCTMFDENKDINLLL